jgi:hypothetical protein
MRSSAIFLSFSRKTIDCLEAMRWRRGRGGGKEPMCIVALQAEYRSRRQSIARIGLQLNNFQFSPLLEWAD